MKAQSAMPNTHIAFDYARKELIRLLRNKGIRDERVLQAMHDVPRHLFTDAEYTHLAYQDQSLPIGHEQTISQPYVVAYMTQTLIEKDIDVVLEVGTGSGYQTAILAQLIPRVFTVERIPDLSRKARALLKKLGYKNIHFRISDGSLGWKQFAPYQAIIVTAAADTVPEKLYQQLATKGRMIIPLGRQNEVQQLTLLTSTIRGSNQQSLCKVQFVPLIEKRD
ncbi:MAG: protein-L-isoaspartate(D-aspartate) O-methyltransferase [Chromatiales bacterium]|nr:protein-L-isoaspartate(D-aspartate) O-methyltransferase [Chromatiales bacterium]